MNKEEIEKAKDDLAFFNEGDYITKESILSIIKKEKEKAYCFFKGDS